MSYEMDPKVESSQAKVLDLSAFKKKKETEKEISRARRPLYVNSTEGTISGAAPSQQTRGDQRVEFPDRLMKIRSSLDRINQLMTEIKKLSAQNGKSEKH